MQINNEGIRLFSVWILSIDMNILMQENKQLYKQPTRSYLEGIVQGAPGWNLKVAYAWIFFDGIISTSPPDCKTNECHFVPLGKFRKVR